MSSLPLDCIITGDCREIMPELTDGSVDLIVTSPPYPGQKGNDMDVWEWIAWFHEALVPMKTLLKPAGVLALNVMFKRDKKGWFNTDHLSDIPALFQVRGLNILDVYMFVKPNPAPNGPLTFCDFPAWEPVFVGTKATRVEDVYFRPARKTYSPKSLSSDGAVYSTRLHGGKTKKGSTIYAHPAGARQSNVLTLSSSGDQNRPKAAGQSFPLGLPMRFIQQYTRPGDVVLDPFCGVGTTCRAAQMAGRHYIGIEINPEEADAAREWLGLKVPDMNTDTMPLFAHI